MKKKTVVFLIIVGCIMLLSAAALLMIYVFNQPGGEQPNSPREISVVTDDNYPPYIFRNADGELQGILVDQWALWSRTTGVQVKLDAMDWADALLRMQAGEYDVIDTAFYNEERDTWLDFASAYTTIDVPIFHNNKIAGITDAASLVNFEVAVKAGDSCIAILKDAGVTNIVEYPSYEAVIDAAKSGEANIFVIDEPAALYYLYRKGIADEFSRSQSLYSGQLHRAVKQGDEAMLLLVETGFAEISSDTMHQIDDKWFGRAGAMLYLSYYLQYVLFAILLVGSIILWVSLWNHRLRKEVKHKTEELMREKELLNITLQSIGDGVVATGVDGAITLLNPTARRMTRWGEDALGEQFTTVLHLVNEETREPVSSPIEKVLETGKIVGLANHTALVNREGESIPIADGASPIRDASGNIYGVVMVFRDVTEEKIHHEHIEYIMSHDSMTGLYNRWYMEEFLHKHEHCEKGHCALIMGDLNGLKLINDAFGHNEGDRFIQKIAAILQECASPKDIVCRWGGDEFLLLLPNADATEAEGLIARILERCDAESDEKLQLSIALGYALRGPGDSMDAVLREAEQLTYRRKLMIEKSFRSSVINALLSTLAAKSEETEEHAERLQQYCFQIGRIMGISAKVLDEMTLFAMLHDIGKVGINDAILRKPGALSDAEWLEMRKHPEIGFRIAQNNIDLAPISEYILSHHERWDGNGYPRGLCGEEIPVPARILAVVDAFDAMTNERIYSKARTKEEAAAEIKRNAGTQFDPRIATIFVEDVLGL